MVGVAMTFPGGARLTLPSLGPFHVSLAGGRHGRLQERHRTPPPTFIQAVSSPALEEGTPASVGGLSLLVSSHCLPQMWGGGMGSLGLSKGLGQRNVLCS